MNETMLRIFENALRGFIEESVQSEDGLSKEDIEYITAERERITEISPRKRSQARNDAERGKRRRRTNRWQN